MFLTCGAKLLHMAECEESGDDCCEPLKQLIEGSLIDIEIPDGTTNIGVELPGYTPSGAGQLNVYSPFRSLRIHSVIIPASVQKIVSWAIAANYVTVLADTPPELGVSGLSGVNAVYAIYVPASSVSAYQSATNWSTYASKIQAIQE